MINSLRAESFKLIKNKSFWTILAISLMLGILLNYLVIVDWWMMSGTTFEAVGLSELNALPMFLVTVYFNLFIGPLAAFFITKEFDQNGVIKNQIISGQKRSAIYISKYIIYTIGSIIIVVFIPLFTGIILNILMGNSNIFNADNIMYLVRSYSLFTLQFAGFTAILTLLAVITDDSGKTIIISIIFTIFLFGIGNLRFSDLINNVYDYSVFNQLGAVMSPEMTGGSIITALLIGTATIIIMLLTGTFIFNKKEIK